ncbi:MAG: peroxidase [Acidobacteria bacterium]|nr:MAG: peroxidase [Acidobacteriota bacterium]
MDDYRSAPIDAKFAELLILIEKAARRAWEITRADIDAVRAAGWSDEAIYDAITVCALFNFYTTWVDASGVGDLGDYSASGKRMAAEGYVRS